MAPQVGTVLQSVPSATPGSVSASSTKMLSYFDGVPHASGPAVRQESCIPGQVCLLITCCTRLMSPCVSSQCLKFEEV